MPPPEDDKKLLMLNSHPALGRTPLSRKYPESILKQQAYTGHISELAKPGVSDKACASQMSLLGTTRDWVRSLKAKSDSGQGQQIQSRLPMTL